MDLRKCYLTLNECYIKRQKMKPKGVMWHSTGANNPKLKRYVPDKDGKLGLNKYNNHWDTYRPGGRQVCVHAFIGLDKNNKVCTYQTFPFDYKAWHAGGTANNNYIGFEICEDDLMDKGYFNKVYKEAVELTAHLCKLYNLDPKGKNVIICHKDGYKLGIASNHGDIYHWFNKHGKTMEDVRNDVYAILNPKKETSKEAKKEYLNLFATSGNRTVYNTKYVKVGTLNPKKYNGLSYEVIEYSKDKRYAKIKTAYYGNVLICIDTKTVGKEFSITTTKKYK